MKTSLPLKYVPTVGDRFIDPTHKNTGIITETTSTHQNGGNNMTRMEYNTGDSDLFCSTPDFIKLAKIYTNEGWSFVPHVTQK